MGCLTPILTLRTDHPLGSHRLTFLVTPLPGTLGRSTPSSSQKLQVHLGVNTEQVCPASHHDPSATPSCFLCSLLWCFILHFLSQGDHLYLGQPFFFFFLATALSASGSGFTKLALLHWHSFLSCLPGWMASPSRPALYLVDHHVAVLRSTYYMVHASKCLQNG